MVDALGDLTVYGVADNGCITDGTFSFGVINGNYIISMPESGGAKLKCAYNTSRKGWASHTENTVDR